MTIFSDATLAGVAQARQHFADAAPFRHLVIDGFLQATFCQRMLDAFPRFEDRFALNEMGEVGGKAVRTDVANLPLPYRELDTFLQTREFLDYVSTVTGIPDLHYDPDYIGGGTHENRDGQSLAPHIDFNYHPGTREHRRLNLIVYLNHDWESDWGGALALHSDPWNEAHDHKRTVLPLFNRAVIFETNEKSWHGFEAIRLPEDRKAQSRKSFAIYLYTKERAPEEIAPAHATVYVPDAMPQDWQPGKVLADVDLALLQKRFADLRGHLLYLYAREKQLNDELGRALRLPLQGYARQDQAPAGTWPDAWVGPQLEAGFTPQKSMRALAIELYVPPQLDADQVLDIELNAQRWRFTVRRGSTSTCTLKARIARGTPAQLRVHAQLAYSPSQRDAAGDQRSLAWQIRSLSLAH